MKNNTNLKVGNLKIYGVIYKITNKKSKANKGKGKVYIGQTINGFNNRYKAKGKNIERVYNYHKNKKENFESYNKRLLEDIEKYGFNNFEVCEVFDIAFSKEELDIKEKVWIRYYNSISKGYNILEGGTVRKRSKVLERFKTYVKKSDMYLRLSNYYSLLYELLECDNIDDYTKIINEVKKEYDWIKGNRVFSKILNKENKSIKNEIIKDFYLRYGTKPKEEELINYINENSTLDSRSILCDNFTNCIFNYEIFLRFKEENMISLISLKEYLIEKERHYFENYEMEL